MIPVPQRRPSSLALSRPPVTLPRPILPVVRFLWLAIAICSLLLWLVETPLLFHAALQLHNISGMFASISPATWRIGLAALGLSPAAYAVISVGGLYLMTGAMFATGLVIFRARSREVIALLVSYVFVALGPGIINAYAGGPALLGAYPFLSLPLHLFTFVSDCAYFGLFLVPLIFPDGRFAPRWMRWLFAAVLVTLVLPVHLPDALSTLLQIATFVAVVGSPIYRYLKISDRVQREQTKWALYGMLVSLGVFLSVDAVHSSFPALTAGAERYVLFALVGNTLTYLSLAFLPISFGIAILRYRLWEIDSLINRTLVYLSLTVTLAALYIGGVVILQALFRAVTGQSSELAVAISTLAIAALFNPWRRRLQTFIDRRFYRRKYDAARTLASFQASLRDQVDVDQLASGMLNVVNETMQPATAGLWIRGGAE